MGKRKSSNEASDREKKWEKIFNAFVKLSRNLQEDRQFLEDRIKFLNEVIYQMKMEQKLTSTKAELLLGLKVREAFIYKHRYEKTESDYLDFRELLDYLCKNRSKDGGEGENELRKLKNEFDKYKLEKSNEISALLADKNSIWNQYKEMESHFGHQLHKKRKEVEGIVENAQQLVERGEELKSENQKLRSENDELKVESIRKGEEISRLMMEINLLKSKSGNINRDSIRGREKVKKESNALLHTSEKTACNTQPSARKSTGGKAPKKQLGTKALSMSMHSKVPETPRLFSSTFKVPKVKRPSSSLPPKTPTLMR